MPKIVKNNLAPLEWGKHPIEKAFYQRLSIVFFKMLVVYTLTIGLLLGCAWSISFYNSLLTKALVKIESDNERSLSMLKVEIENINALKQYETMQVYPPLVVQYGIISRLSLSNRFLIGNMEYRLEPENLWVDVCADDFSVTKGMDIDKVVFDGFWKVSLLSLTSEMDLPATRIKLKQEFDEILKQIDCDGYISYVPSNSDKEGYFYIAFISKFTRNTL